MNETPRRVIPDPYLQAPLRCIAVPRLNRCGYPFNDEIHNPMSEYFDHYAIVRSKSPRRAGSPS